MKQIVTLCLCIILIIGIMPSASAEQATTYAIKPQYNYVEGFAEGLAAVRNDNKWGFINKKGNEVIKLQYNLALSYSEGLAVVKIGEKYGFIDKTGKEIVKPQYDEASSFSNGLARVLKNGNYAYIDKTGNEIIKTHYKESSYPNNFSEGYARVFSGEDYAYIDTSGKNVFQTEYFSAYSFSDGLARVRPLPQYSVFFGFIDRSGKLVIPAKFIRASDFSDGMAAISDSSTSNYGFIDKSGKIVIKPQFVSVGDFSENLAWVNIDNKYGFIDKSGKIVIKPQLAESVGNFSGGLAFVEIDGKYGYIDKYGKMIIKPSFDAAKGFSEGLASVLVNGLWGYISNPLDTPSSWAKLEVEAASALNLVPDQMQTGYSNNITRADFSKLTVHVLEVKTGKLVATLLSDANKTIDPATFSDTNDPDILAAYSLDIVGGKGNGIFDPNGDITRQEAAVMLARTSKLLGISPNNGNLSFADNNDIASWAKESVSTVVSIQDKTNQSTVMSSTGNNNFSPKASYTKQQAFITMKRLFNSL